MIFTIGRLALGLSALANSVQAFPTPDNLVKLAQAESLTSEQLHEQLSQLKERSLLFNSLDKPISVDGIHKFQAPNLEKGDQRGPCPGLNALANHGYINRSGVAGFVEVIAGINQVFGMGIDLATILAIMGTAGVGNPLSLNPGFSIGGESRKSQNLLGNLLGLLGAPGGLDASHNWIEADSSNTRDDLFVTGDASTMNMDLFMEVYNSFEGKETLSMEHLGNRAAERMADSIATNPVFYYGPYTGMVVRNAGYAFSGRLLSNHSKEYPQGGHLTREVFMSFWGVHENDKGKIEYKKGWERIPNNWYRIQGEYGLVSLNLDLISWVTQHPELGNIGGNLGEVNSFAGVDITDISGGVVNALNLLEGNNLMCFTMNLVKTFAPNSLSSLFKTLEKPLNLLNGAFSDPLLDLDCPAFDELTARGTNVLEKLKKFPGAAKGAFAL